MNCLHTHIYFVYYFMNYLHTLYILYITAKDEEEDDLMIKWFQLVNEKNELVRKECDYIYV